MARGGKQGGQIGFGIARQVIAHWANREGIRSSAPRSSEPPWAQNESVPARIIAKAILAPWVAGRRSDGAFPQVGASGYCEKLGTINRDQVRTLDSAAARRMPRGMILKPLDQITEADLNDLVTNAVSEQKTLDYKQQLPDPNDAGKRELLADVSSFANTAGGDLIFGMTESAGVPSGMPGVQIANTDQEILRLDSIIRTGLAPRIRHTTRAVPLANGRHVLIIRSERSWYGPHRVVFKGDSRFWGRTSNGKYELDVTDLRNAFLFANTVTEKVEAFRAERVMALAGGQAPIPLASGPMLVIHCMPLESFAARPQFDVFSLPSLNPMYSSRLQAWDSRINFEGKICVSMGQQSFAYTQVYRNGTIEAARAGILNSTEDPSVIPSLAYEQAVIEYVPYCLLIQKKLGCSSPVLVGIALIGVRGMRMPADAWSMTGSTPIDRDVLLLPEIVVEDLATPIGPLLKPALDLVWNACGQASSPYFDAAGNWLPTNH